MIGQWYNADVFLNAVFSSEFIACSRHLKELADQREFKAIILRFSTVAARLTAYKKQKKCLTQYGRHAHETRKVIRALAFSGREKMGNSFYFKVLGIV